jgi:hypothetical protein
MEIVTGNKGVPNNQKITPNVQYFGLEARLEIERFSIRTA